MPTQADLLRLLAQARAWFSRHPQRDDAVSVEADPLEVRRWMETVDRETGPAPLDDAGAVQRTGRTLSPPL